MITIKNAAQIKQMSAACTIAAEALKLAGKNCKAGVDTAYINEIVHRYIVEQGAKPSFLGYNGFSASTCISVNDTVIHGIPSKKEILKDGDIVSVDVGAYFDGYHGDNAATFAVGTISDNARELIDVTKQCFYAGFAVAIKGNRVGDISAAVEAKAREHGFGVTKQYVGHGVGKALHESPEVPNFGVAGRGARLVPGMTLAIEPMITESGDDCKTLKDGWTVKTIGGVLASHYENTILITEAEPIILTQHNS